MAAHEAAATPVVRKLSQTQQRLLARAYAQLDAVWEPYYVPRRGERY